jgi:HSP20 family molecular chaperone IbpA
MPSKSPKQARMMAAAAHNPQFARKVGVPVKVAKEYNAADSGTGILKIKLPKKSK